MTETYVTRTVTIKAGPKAGSKTVLVYLWPDKKQELDDCETAIKKWNPMHGETQNHKNAVEMLIRSKNNGTVPGRVTGGARKKGHRYFTYEPAE